ncbi:MAG: MgtC/SapB family protein [candidate division KSB1 bacterium]|nr:MgtC/SapB family protein [candidate division KSB1 bacterium]MDZ7333663.1 MgtC/SapB family protein [candidate division KSB1 bacterium]MDZ7356111.1 MgtC/SapB family protein [candidate division KSB1 bacterium]MDZ7375895.1 MgtC/SapB family protein [candidate division KSB1 bacterium]MDZ7398912.1 MgtC/SapB family protein [candidate division KSB1 bacterium]
MSIEFMDAVKLLLAILSGALIGAEREYRDKTAGFRTLIFICVGATLFTMFSLKIGGENDPRIAANIVSGIGFLGAGVILREKGRVLGLTTAAMIWLTAAVGMGIGSGYFLLSGLTVIFVLIILLVFPRFERMIDLARETRSYEIVCALRSEKATDLQQLFQRNKLTVRSFKQEKSGDKMTCTVVVVGSPRNHEQARQKLLQDPEVQSFTF